MPSLDTQRHEEVVRRLDRLEQLLIVILKGEFKIMATIDQTLADVQSEATVVDSLATLTASLKKSLDDALSGATLPPAVQAKVDAVFAQVEANKQKLADAVIANTPSAPAP